MVRDRPPRTVIRTRIGTADACYFHFFDGRCGFCLTDVKPTNIFLIAGDLSRVKLLDFGIARRAAASLAMTRTGLVIGTPEYMAPEQVRGARDVGPAADIFSLGCVLYECLAGRPPFVAEHIAAVLARILFEDPAPVAAHRSGIPEPVTALLGRMLAKDAAARLPNAAALCRMLGELESFRDPSAPFVVPPLTRLSLFAESERGLFSVVVASPPQSDRSTLDTLTPKDDQREQDLRRALHGMVQNLGAQAEYLVDGSLLVTFQGAGSAIDLAARAAHCALLIKDRWSEAELAMATGRGSVRGHLPVGEAVDRAAGLLQAHLSSPTPVLAAGAAERDAPAPTGVWLDELSAHLLERHFSVREVPSGILLLSGIADSDEARPLLGKPTSCVGREQELSILDALLIGSIEEGELRVVLITAPPGGGKSRLRHEFLRRIAGRETAPAVLIGRGNMMNAGAPYSVLRDALRRLCAITGGESLDVQREKLALRSGKHLPPAERQKVIEFLGELCGIPFPADKSPQLQSARHDPKIMSDQITASVLTLLRAEVRERPVLLVLEDLHWGDTLSVKLLDTALRELARQPFMVVALARPEVYQLFPKLWQAHKLMEMNLGGLSRRASERLIQQILGKQLSAEIVTRLVEQASGSPLYLEELIRAYSVAHLDGLPATVLAMLQARLGRLVPGQRRVLLAASVFGDTFWRDGIYVLCGSEQTHAEIDQSLDELVALELIELHRQSRLRAAIEYGFSQSLLREAAYGLLTSGDRQIGHCLAADFLESAGETDANILAGHYLSGAQPELAAPWFLKAAEECLASNDLAGTLLRADRALGCGVGGELAGQLYALKAWAYAWHGEAAASFQVAAKSVELLPAGSYYWCFAMAALLANAGMLGRKDDLYTYTERFLAAQPRSDAVGEYVQAGCRMVSIFSFLGVPSLGHIYFERAQEAGVAAPADPLVQRWLLYGRACDGCLAGESPWSVLELAQQATAAFRLAGDLRNAVFSCGLTAEMLCELGDRAQAAEVLREPLTMMQRLDERYLQVFLRAHLAWVLAGLPEDAAQAEASALADTLIATADIIPAYKGWAHAARAQLLQLCGKWQQAETEARAAIELLGGTPTILVRARRLLLDALLHNGRPQEVLQLAPPDPTPPMLEGRERERSSKLGACELGIRLAQVEALRAIGEAARAEAILRRVLTLIAERTRKIPEPQWQDRFARIPEHLRAQALSSGGL